ncbi:MAG: lanthionine synthetase LanC family protein [Candidatus Hydrogenedentota bacterium]
MKKNRIFLLATFLISTVHCQFTTAQEAADKAFLKHALDAEQFIASQKLDEATWRKSLESGDESNHTFYQGGGGIALYYLELYAATGEQRFLDTATRAGHEIVAASAKNVDGTISLHSGLTADVFVLNELYKRTKEPAFRSGALKALARIKANAKELGSGVGWIEQNPFAAYNAANTNIGEMYDLTIGSAGVGVMLLYAHREGLDDDAVAWAVKIADRLLEVAEKTKGGLRWPMMDNLPAPYIMPNFAHGPAGIGYFFADLYVETNDEKYLNAALLATRYVQSRAVKKGDGILVTHHERPEPADLYYLGRCHGPAGTGRLMYLLSQITGDGQWMEWIDANLRGMESTGAPEKRSEGLWNNVSQCCGDSGLGDYALYLYSATGDEKYLELGRRIARYVLSQANSEDGKLSWTTAEMRIKPEFTQTQTGYMQGAAGMGSFFLHLATIEEDPVKISLLATPFE